MKRKRNLHKKSVSDDVKTSETRLKEISQRAKQRKNQNVRKPTSNQKQQKFKSTWFYIGIGGATVLGIAYLIFREPTKIEYKFVPITPKDDRPDEKQPKKQNKAALATIPEEDEKKTAPTPPTFELNCF